MSDATATLKKATSKKAPAKRAGAVKAPTEENERTPLGNRLTALRVARKLTQKQIADELGYGTAQFVSNWERGISEPPLTSIVALAKILGTGRNALIDMIFAARFDALRAAHKNALAKYGVKK